MTRLPVTIAVLIIGGVLLLPSLAYTAEKFGLTGTEGCSICHKVKERAKTWDNAFEIWTESKHAKAYVNLTSDQAKKIATAEGIANPQTSEKCLKCHSTAYGVEKSLLGKKFKIDDGVSCEACHGPGEEWKSAKVHAESRPLALQKGMNDVWDSAVKDKICQSCHTEEVKIKEHPERSYTAEEWKKMTHPTKKMKDGKEVAITR